MIVRFWGYLDVGEEETKSNTLKICVCVCVCVELEVLHIANWMKRRSYENSGAVHMFMSGLEHW